MTSKQMMHMIIEHQEPYSIPYMANLVNIFCNNHLKLQGWTIIKSFQEIYRAT